MNESAICYKKGNIIIENKVSLPAQFRLCVTQLNIAANEPFQAIMLGKLFDQLQFPNVHLSAHLTSYLTPLFTVYMDRADQC